MLDVKDGHRRLRNPRSRPEAYERPAAFSSADRSDCMFDVSINKRMEKGVEDEGCVTSWHGMVIACCQMARPADLAASTLLLALIVVGHVD